ncbi:predicted protein [Chaetomium globosum CBS 148.51]|uniref:Uncharacterized protein n=1 Tax=Chaetomium globosum (strain ATCC 6205 / CBS 148.51 / DSM 1962 / NBRC 6347 / NRRL 1970) TaxID=306901 RepID=Q2H588_CHAGB|nr:uncharacterized protein CHGG_06177 [Chaetomium globosum CBS 148.51]EAQ89558.1 predicted protein [Chaetomium globosum CBS 148.51]
MTVHPTMASFNNGLCRFGGSFADPDRPRSCESPGVATDGRSVPASQRSSSRSGLAPGVVIDSQARREEVKVRSNPGTGPVIQLSPLGCLGSVPSHPSSRSSGCPATSDIRQEGGKP